MTTPLYLDHAATTPLLPAAAAAMREGFALWANPSSPHAAGRRARAALEDARERVRAVLEWGGEVVFTSSASEALALGVKCSRQPLRAVSAVEHEAVLRCANSSPAPGGGPPLRQAGRAAAQGKLLSGQAMEEVLPERGSQPTAPFDSRDAAPTSPQRGRMEILPVDAAGLVDPAAGGLPGLVAVQQVNNETGVIQPLAEVAAAVHAAGGVLLADCAQGVGKLPLPDADLIAFSAHKFGGPVGVGALLVRDFALLEAGGGQERGYRAGTENLPGALGMTAALEAGCGWLAEAIRLRNRLEAGIVAGGGEPVAGGAERLATIGAYRMPGVSAAVQLIRFDAAGIAVSAGSACSSGSLRSSHVLAAIDHPHPGEVIRVSLGRETTQDDVDRFLAAWRTIARREIAA